MVNSENPSQVSEFYLACRNDDVDFVKEYLTTLSDTETDWNRLESSVNSTPLHAASYYGHKEIVQLLLQHECDRSQINGYGLTAYEEAANDEIRQLFERPTNGSNISRFQDENTHNSFDFVRRPKENNKRAVIPADMSQSEPESPKTPSVHGYKTEPEKQLETGYATTSIAMCQSKLGRFITDRFQHGAPMSLKSMGIRLQEIIDEKIDNTNPLSQKANELLQKFLNDDGNGRIQYLIRLYTLETKFYRGLRHNPIPLALPLYITLETLKDRYFQGQTYRGVKMDDDEIAAYEWGVKNHGSVLQTRHFFSTSIKRSVAEGFSTDLATNDIQKKSVLFIFAFPEKCNQAINLGRISNEQPCLSEFENEAEVLILPWTLFQVDSVERESSSSSCTIYLTNVLLPRKHLVSSLAWVLKHPKGSVDRFQQYFPEK